MKSIQKMIAALLLIAMLATMVACGDNNTQTSDPTQESLSAAEQAAQTYGVPLINNGEPVTIIVNLGEYEPSDNEVPTEDAPIVFNSTRALIAKFMQMHPNVTVELDKTSPTTGGDYVASLNQWMLPRLAAGTQMDIATNLAGAELFGDSDWFIDVSAELETENPYIPEGEKGHDRWADQWPTYLWSSNVIKNTKGQIVSIP